MTADLFNRIEKIMVNCLSNEILSEPKVRWLEEENWTDKKIPEGR
jgi:hypothetical protein